MNDQDYERIYQALLEVLNRYQLGWVIDQVTDQLRLGKTEVTEIELVDNGSHRTSLDVVDVPRIRTRRAKKEAFLKTREYTPREQLLVLVDAIEQAVVNTNTMVHDALKYFQEEFDVTEISFYSEERQTSKTFNSNEQKQRVLVAERLKTLLDALRREVNAH